MSDKDQSPLNNPEIRYIPVPVDQYPYSEDFEEKIDLITVLNKIWRGRKLILVTVSIFLLYGLIIAFTSPNEYTTEVKLLPESQQQSSLGVLSGIARQFGLPAGEQINEEIPTTLYSEITQSTPFLKRLLDFEVTHPEVNERITLKTYYFEYRDTAWNDTFKRYTIRLPITIFRVIRRLVSTSDEPERISQEVREFMREGDIQRINNLTPDEWGAIQYIRDRILIEQDLNMVTVQVRMPDPLLAAEMAVHVVELLSEYVIEYRTEKTRQDMEFIEELFEEARRNFDDAQEELAIFIDQNMGQLTALARTREQVLQSRYDLTINIYNSMAERLEEVRMKLQEETPVVTILEPAAVPLVHSEPERGLIIFIYTIMGFILGTGFIYSREIWTTLNQRGLFEDDKPKSP